MTKYVSVLEQDASLLLSCFNNEVYFSPRAGCLVAGLFQRRGIFQSESKVPYCQVVSKMRYGCFNPSARFHTAALF